MLGRRPRAVLRRLLVHRLGVVLREAALAADVTTPPVRVGDESHLLLQLLVLLRTEGGGVLAGVACIEYVFPPFPGDFVTILAAVLVTAASWSACMAALRFALSALRFCFERALLDFDMSPLGFRA